MKNYDVVIVGASTAGSYFARRMAEKGFSVLLLEKDTRENLSPSYDIFHMAKDEMEQTAGAIIRSATTPVSFPTDL